MRIARFAKGNDVAYGVVGETRTDGATGGASAARPPLAVIAELSGHPFSPGKGGVQFTGETYPLAEVRLLAPVLPSKVVAVGGNYAGNDREMGAEPGASAIGEPVLFLKPSTAVVGHGDQIAYPVKLTQRVDYQGELAVIIGRLCREVPAAQAADVIFGYTCANDVTARDLQARDGQWTRAKGFDTFCPLGPWIETDVDPADLELTTSVNEEVRQRARTSRAALRCAGPGGVHQHRDDPAAGRCAAHRDAGRGRAAGGWRRGIRDRREHRVADQHGGRP